MAYATGFVVASGGWGSDISDGAARVDGAWDLRITIGNRGRAPVRVVASNKDLDLALLRTPIRNLPTILARLVDASAGRRSAAGSACSAIPFRTSSTTKASAWRPR